MINKIDDRTWKAKILNNSRYSELQAKSCELSRIF